MLPRNELKRIVEAVLMAAREPVSIGELHLLFESNAPEKPVLRDIIAELATEYHGHGIELQEIASGYRFQTCSDLTSWVSKLWEERPPRYSHALLETLAVIAYKQPITRAEIEDIRGVTLSSNIMRTLLEREWIKIAGHKNVPGRPGLYTTTPKFLDYFNLNSIKELPILDDITDLDAIAEQLSLGLPSLT